MLPYILLTFVNILLHASVVREESWRPCTDATPQRTSEFRRQNAYLSKTFNDGDVVWKLLIDYSINLISPPSSLVSLSIRMSSSRMLHRTRLDVVVLANVLMQRLVSQWRNPIASRPSSTHTFSECLSVYITWGNTDCDLEVVHCVKWGFLSVARM
jgi:hypothetical protein